nr:hypothetical protein [Staphylococcus schleiferi]
MASKIWHNVSKHYAIKWIKFIFNLPRSKIKGFRFSGFYRYNNST